MTEQYKGESIRYVEETNTWHIDNKVYVSLTAAKKGVDAESKEDLNIKLLSISGAEYKLTSLTPESGWVSKTNREPDSWGSGRQKTMKYDWVNYLLDTPEARAAVAKYKKLQAEIEALNKKKLALSNGLPTLKDFAKDRFTKPV